MSKKRGRGHDQERKREKLCQKASKTRVTPELGGACVIRNKLDHMEQLAMVALVRAGAVEKPKTKVPS